MLSPSLYPNFRMKPHGTYKLRHGPRRRSFPVATLTMAQSLSQRAEALVASAQHADAQAQRVIDSLRDEIVEAGDACELRIRRIFLEPREVFRLELERPEYGYLRTTLLERDALEELLESEGVQEIVDRALPA